MKKLLYLFMVLLTFAGCKKEEELNFDDRPEVRMNRSIEEVNTIWPLLQTAGLLPCLLQVVAVTVFT
jgi:uncharacterized protein YcfL